jgi:hypothetical protein
MRLHTAAAILVVVAVGAAACGSGSNGAATPTGAASVTGAPSVTPVLTRAATASPPTSTSTAVATRVGEPVATAAASVGVATAMASTVQPASPMPEPTPKTLASPETITIDDGGALVTMRVGEEFLLNLGDDIYDWNVEVSDQAVLGRVVNITVVRGAQGVYEARAAGRVTLTATGDPHCRSAVPACALPSRLFRVDVVVS